MSDFTIYDLQVGSVVQAPDSWAAISPEEDTHGYGIPNRYELRDLRTRSLNMLLGDAGLMNRGISLEEKNAFIATITPAQRLESFQAAFREMVETAAFGREAFSLAGKQLVMLTPPRANKHPRGEGYYYEQDFGVLNAHGQWDNTMPVVATVWGDHSAGGMQKEPTIMRDQLGNPLVLGESRCFALQAG